jgi:hypothetical protein
MLNASTNPNVLTGLGNETATVTVSPHRYELHTLPEALLVERKRHGWKAMDRLIGTFSYIVGDMEHDARLTQYRGAWMDVFDMEYLSAERFPTGGILNLLARDGWTGWASDSAWSGTVVRYLDGDDEGFVRIATVVWS